MINKLIEKWKQEWWNNNSELLHQTYNDKILEIVKRGEAEVKELEELWNRTKESKIRLIKMEEEEIRYKLDSLESRKRELAHLDTDVKNQIKLMEAKTNPSFVWETAFTAGATKTWDLMEKLMLGNYEKLKTQLFNEATEKAIKTLGNNKKNN